MKKLSSMVFVEIPQEQMTDNSLYGKWLVEEVERKWMIEFNHRNKHWRPNFVFNSESGIYGFIEGNWIYHCKFYRYDGNMPFVSYPDFIAHRGFLIREHDDVKGAAERVQLITNNLEEFLKQQKIEYKREDC